MPLHDRRSRRLRGWDYTSPASYFITTCLEHRVPLFGNIQDGRMQLTDAGRIVDQTWQWLATQYSYVTVDESCVMPDHFHGILVIGRHERIKPLGQLIGAFKTVSTKRINLLRQMPGKSIWQRDFVDRVIRDYNEMTAIRDYIRGQVANYRD